MWRKLLTKNTVLLDQAIYSGISFGITIAMSRSMNLNQFGMFSSLIIILYLFSALSQSLIIQPMQAKVKMLTENRGYARMLFYMQIILSVGIVYLGYAFASFFSSISDLSINQIMCFCIYLGIFIFFDFIRKYLLAIDEAKACLYMDLIYALTTGVVFLTLPYFQPLSIELSFIVLIWCIFPPAIYGSLMFFRKSTKSVHWGGIKEQLIEGKWYLFAAISQWFASNFFVISSGVFLSLEALGALRLVQTFFGLFNIFLQSVENYVIPKVNLLLESSYQEGARFLNGLLRKSLLFIVPSLVLLFLFSKDAMLLFGGERFEEYHQMVKGFVILYFAIFLFYPVRILVRAKGFKKSFFLGYLISGVFGIFTCQFFFEQFTTQGAAVGLIMGQIILFSTWVYYLNSQKIKLWKLYTSF